MKRFEINVKVEYQDEDEEILEKHLQSEIVRLLTGDLCLQIESIDVHEI